MMNQTEQDPKDVFDLLIDRGYQYEPIFDGWQKPQPHGEVEWIASDSVRKLPGDVRYYLLTGFVRSIHIFDCGMFIPTPESMGFRVHTDGHCVRLKRIK